MKKFLVLGSLFLFQFSFAQKEKVQLYIDIYKDIAMQEMQRSGVPASITLAQGILESKFGQSDLSLKSNNHFGIKCKLDWNGEKVYSDDDTKQECFRKYPSPQDSYRDHSDFLKSRTHYAWLFSLDPTDYEAWAKGLKKSGYATESDYSERLISLIKEYNLNQYSLKAIGKGGEVKNVENNVINNNNKVNNNNNKLTNNSTITTTDFKPKTSIKTTVVPDEKDEVENVVKPTTAVASITKEESYPNTIFNINGSKVLFVKAGTSVLALANEHNISLSKIFEINDMNEVEILEENKLVYLEKKQKKGNKDFHVVTTNESLHDIAQKEGVRLEMIEEYNSVSKKLNPIVGEKIYLRSKAPVIPKMTTASTTNNNQTVKPI